MKWKLSLAAVLAFIVATGIVWLRTQQGASRASRPSQSAQHHASRATLAPDGVRRSAEAGGPNADRPTSSDPFVALKARAEAGDAVSQRRLAEVYEECGAYSVDPKRFLANLDFLAELNPKSKKAILRVKSKLTETCREVDGGAPIPTDAVKLWLEQSARGGDLAAKSKLALYSPTPPSPDAVADLAGQGMQGKDPEAMMAISQIAINPCTGALASERLCGTPSAEWTWAIAACRAGSACGPDSRVMRQVCISTGRCYHAHYEAFILGELVPPEQRREIEQRVQVITGRI